MKSRQSSCSTLILLLILLEIVIGASWVARIKAVESFLSWEERFVSLLGMVTQDYQFYKTGIFVVIFFILISRLFIIRRKPRKYKLPMGRNIL